MSYSLDKVIDKSRNGFSVQELHSLQFVAFLPYLRIIITRLNDMVSISKLYVLHTYKTTVCVNRNEIGIIWRSSYEYFSLKVILIKKLEVAMEKPIAVLFEIKLFK